MAQTYRAFDPCCLLAPVPAVMVTCCGAGESEQPNIITVAWAGTVNSDPPMLSISVRPSRYSYHLLVDSGEFVVNLVAHDACKALDFCGVRSGRDVHKFEALGLTPAPAKGMDRAPYILGSPAYLACKLRQRLSLGSHDMFIGEVVGVEVREDLFDADGSLHLERAGLVCYTHGVYQQAKEVLGFFGYSVAREEVLKRRLSAYRARDPREKKSPKRQTESGYRRRG